MNRLKKYELNLQVKEVLRLHERYVLLKLTTHSPLPDMMPGQFVEVLVTDSVKTFLRRPISICFVDRDANELWLLIATIGDGTRHMALMKQGEMLNCVLPLGHGFTISTVKESSIAEVRPLLVGGGVGVAPLLYHGATLKASGITPTFLLGARTKNDLLLIDEFRKYGDVHITTEDGSDGECGFVTQHSILHSIPFTLIQSCGPTPMMKAVARYARQQRITCEVSLENMMACGLGACLCCVEKTTEGNLCVCKEGPVFNTDRLLWSD